MLLHLQEFAQTLNIDQCRLLITEAFSSRGGIELAKALLEPSPEFLEESNNSWCICGKCQPMDNPIENVCCRQRCCVTTPTYFETGVLDTTVLSITIVNRSEIFVDDPEYTPASYRKAAYRQWILWQHGYLGRSNRRIVPSCMVWAVRNRYPAPDGRYKEY